EADPVDHGVAIDRYVLLGLGLVDAPLDLGQQRVDRIGRGFDLLPARLPLREEGVAGAQAIDRLLQLDEAPQGERIPVIGRRYALELTERGLVLAPLVEQMAEVNPCL